MLIFTIQIIWMKTHHDLSMNEVKDLVALYRVEAEHVAENYYEFNADECDYHTLSILDDIEIKICKAYLHERCYLERWPVVSYS